MLTIVVCHILFLNVSLSITVCEVWVYLVCTALWNTAMTLCWHFLTSLTALPSCPADQEHPDLQLQVWQCRTPPSLWRMYWEPHPGSFLPQVCLSAGREQMSQSVLLTVLFISSLWANYYLFLRGKHGVTNISKQKATLLAVTEYNDRVFDPSEKFILTYPLCIEEKRVIDGHILVIIK